MVLDEGLSRCRGAAVVADEDATAGDVAAPRDLPGFDRMVGRDELVRAVSGLDYFVLLTPLTPQTRGIVAAAVLLSAQI